MRRPLDADGVMVSTTPEHRSIGRNDGPLDPVSAICSVHQVVRTATAPTGRLISQRIGEYLRRGRCRSSGSSTRGERSRPSARRSDLAPWTRVDELTGEDVCPNSNCEVGRSLRLVDVHRRHDPRTAHRRDPPAPRLPASQPRLGQGRDPARPARRRRRPVRRLFAVTQPAPIWELVAARPGPVRPGRLPGPGRAPQSPVSVVQRAARRC